MSEIIDQLFIEETPKTPLDLLYIMYPEGSTYCKVYTYYDKECTDLQGNENRRSFDDLYILFKTYFPEITKKEVLELIAIDLHFYFCDRICKIVFHRVDGKPKAILENFKDTKYNVSIDKYTENTHTLSDFIDILENS